MSQRVGEIFSNYPGVRVPPELLPKLEKYYQERAERQLPLFEDLVGRMRAIEVG